MSNLRAVLLVSTLALAACGGSSGGSGGNSNSSPSFDGDKAGEISIAAVRITNGAPEIGRADDATYNPRTKRLEAGGVFDGTIRDGGSAIDRNGNGINVTNPDRTRYVRRFAASNSDASRVYNGVMGFETEEMPRSASLTYNGTTDGYLMTEGTTREYDARVRMTANTATGRGTYKMNNVKARDGRSMALTGISENVVLDDETFQSARDGSLNISSGRNKTLGSEVGGRNVGFFYGPDAQEVGGSYYYGTTEAAITGRYTGKR